MKRDVTPIGMQPKHYLLFIFLTLASISFCQKVVIIKKLTNGWDKDFNIIELKKDSHERISQNYDFDYQLTNSGDYILCTDEDSLLISDRLYSESQILDLAFSNEKMIPADIAIKHIQSFPLDTIIISGISFTK